MGYAELACLSNFSFLEGASQPQELAAQASVLGLAGFAVTDRNTMAGIARAHAAIRTTGGRLVPGTRLVFRDGSPDVLAWPGDIAAWGRLTRLLTLGNGRAPKGSCYLDLPDLLEWGAGLMLAPLGPRRLDAGKAAALETALAALQGAFPGCVWLAAAVYRDGGDARRLARLAAIAGRTGTRLLAVSDALYHAPERRPLQDIVTCIREGRTLDNAGRLLGINAERHMRSPAEMARLFADYPGAVTESLRVLERLRFSLGELKYEYPDEPVGDDPNPTAALRRLAYEGAAWRYPEGLSEKNRATLEHELALIQRLEYEPYFLTVHDIVQFARSKEILCQGRGSAANSFVCFCLGITSVSPELNVLLFERFVSASRNEPPDIDVDFEHARREEVIQYVYEKYGRHRAGLAATVICYRARSAVREVGKVFGFSEDAVTALSKTIWGWSTDAIKPEEAKRVGLDPEDPTVLHVLGYAKALMNFPRHLSQHVGGFVIARHRLDEQVPIQNAAMEKRTVIEWDKDDLESVGMMKVDVLALGMLTAIAKAFVMLKNHYGVEQTIAGVKEGDAPTYQMIQRADTVGVFQIESRAQMSMLPRLKPEKYYDLVIEVAIVRPGPIQGDMVHPYLKRRAGLEAVDYEKEELRGVLEKTLGVPLFQEQAMRIAMVAADFSAERADQLRRAMATFRHVGTIHTFKEDMIEGMVRKGYRREFAERCFRQIEGFGSYGFPESHAASFAILVYVSSWIKCHYPDVFGAAILNAQPMGFYAPSQLVRDAREHGVEVRPVDINHSDHDCTLEPGAAGGALHRRHAEQEPAIRSTHALRLGFRLIKGFAEADGEAVMEHRGAGYDSVRDLWLRTGLERAAIERLADADAFRSIGLDRRAALWAARGLMRTGDTDRLPLFAAAAGTARLREPDFALPRMPLGEHVVHDYRYLSLSLKAHPVGFLRPRLAAERVTKAEDLGATANGRRVAVAGLVIIRQRPGSAKGVIFMTIEDETGIANLIVWPKTFEVFRPVVMGARFVRAIGRMHRQGLVMHVVVERLVDETAMLAHLAREHGGVETFARCDAVRKPGTEERPKARVQRGDLLPPRADWPEPALEPGFEEELMIAEEAKAVVGVMPKGRNFH
jgi:error-prone DNA polymerase